MVEPPYKHYGQLIAELRNEFVVVIKAGLSRKIYNKSNAKSVRSVGKNMSVTA